MGEQRAVEDFVIGGRREFQGSDTQWKVLPGFAVDGHTRGTTTITIKDRNDIFLKKAISAESKMYEHKDTGGLTNVRESPVTVLTSPTLSCY